MLESLDSLFKDGFEENKDVRQLWYVFCFHFLSQINKNWKASLEGSRLLKPTLMYDHITTSDQAMVLWFIKIWEPKIKSLSENGWPVLPKATGEGEQELKAGLKDYIRYYNMVAAFEQRDKGALALKWNSIFWEELILNHPNIFKKGNPQGQDHVNNDRQQEGNEEVLVLPGIDADKNHLRGNYFRQNSTVVPPTTINAGTTYINNSNVASVDSQNSQNDDNNDNGESSNTTVQENNNSNSLPNNFFLDEIKNPTNI